MIAVTACVLALCGYEVSCACYSDYLCKQNYNAFKPLFESLNLLNVVHYGTFSKLCEEMINREGDIRKIVGELISTQNWSHNKNTSEMSPKILIIDEVDVFFHKDFYGDVCTPSVSLSDPTIQELTDYIWNNRASNLRLAHVIKSEPYLKCCARFSPWKFLIAKAVKDMLADAKPSNRTTTLPKMTKLLMRLRQTSYSILYMDTRRFLLIIRSMLPEKLV